MGHFMSPCLAQPRFCCFVPLMLRRTIIRSDILTPRALLSSHYLVAEGLTDRDYLIT